MIRLAVTGTNGKTSTVRWIGAALEALDGPVGLVLNSGYLIDGESVSFEHSADGFLAFDRALEREGASALAVEATSLSLSRGLADAWHCDVAVLTNITHDHLDLHGDWETYVATKARLFAGLEPGGRAILNVSDPSAMRIAAGLRTDVHTWTYALTAESADFTALVQERAWGSTSLRSTGFTDGPLELLVAATGDHFAENALAACCAAQAVGVDPRAAATAISRCPLPYGRFEILCEAPVVVIDFAHSPDALQRTCMTAKQLTPGAVIAVSGAGGNVDRSKRPAMGRALGIADHVYLTTDNARDEDPAAIALAMREGLADHPSVHTVLDRALAIESTIINAAPEDAVLILGRGREPLLSLRQGRLPLSDFEVATTALRRR
jgi:UDP-N-acetylmuramoyl-L-alanyl-D-glutamate--2,6-diaminopimelate ligase